LLKIRIIHYTFRLEGVFVLQGDEFLKKNLLFLSGIVLFLLFAEINLAEKKMGHSFNYKFRIGQELLYLITVHGKVEVETPAGTETSPLHIEMEVTQKVASATADEAEIEMVVCTAKTFQGSDSANLPEEGQKILVSMDKNGNMEFKSGTGNWQGSEFAQLVFPSKPLEVGNFWFQEGVTNISGLSTKTRTKFVFSGFEQVMKRNCAVFESQLILEKNEMNFVKPSASSRGKIFFSPDLGQIVKTVVESRFEFTMPLEIEGGKTANTITTLYTEMRLIAE